MVKLTGRAISHGNGSMGFGKHQRSMSTDQSQQRHHCAVIKSFKFSAVLHSNTCKVNTQFERQMTPCWPTYHYSQERMRDPEGFDESKFHQMGGHHTWLVWLTGQEDIL